MTKLLTCFLLFVSLVSAIAKPDPLGSAEKHRMSARLRRQDIQELEIPMDWIEESPYSEEEGVGIAVDYQNSPADQTKATPVHDLPSVPVMDEEDGLNLPPGDSPPNELELAPQYPPKSGSKGGPKARSGPSNDDYMDSFMQDLGIPPEKEAKPTARPAKPTSRPVKPVKPTRRPAKPSRVKPREPSKPGHSSGQSEAKKIDLSKLVDICDKPVVITSANRYSNTTVRLFRLNDYWDLMGLPDRQAFVSKKMKLSPPLAPVDRKTSIVTILSGPLKDMTYKFSKSAFWAWNDTTGQQVSGGRGGEFWMDLPKDASDGFDTMFHNGNQTKPMIIAFKGQKVWYISTDKKEFEFIGDERGYIGGRNKEKWPAGVTAALTYPLGDKISVYLFRDDKHCVRDVNPLPSGKDCDEWRENFQLFGCKKVELMAAPDPTTATTSAATVANEPTGEAGKDKTPPTTTSTTTPKSSANTCVTSTRLLAIVFCTWIVLTNIF